MRISILFIFLFFSAFFQAQIDSINLIHPAAITAVTSDERAPFTHSDFDAEDFNDYLDRNNYFLSRGTHQKHNNDYYFFLSDLGSLLEVCLFLC